jgi:hypothetical protein
MFHGLSLAEFLRTVAIDASSAVPVLQSYLARMALGLGALSIYVWIFWLKCSLFLCVHKN